jgi:membrane protease subunit HflK
MQVQPDRSGKHSQQGGPMKKETIRSIRLVSLIVLIILLISIGRSSVFTVKESEQAVIMTFGRYTKTVDAGLHAKLPWPFQSVSIVPVNLTQKIELGYYSTGSGSYYSIPEESMMITGDMNIVNIDFFVEWKISDPVKYLFESDNPTSILKNMIQSTVRAVVGTKSIDDVLTTGKIQIQADVKEMLRQRLIDQDIGVMILDVKVNDSEPPTEDVARAFREVETAKQQKDTALNQSIAYKNSKLPEANAEADKIVRAAEAAKQSKINEALGERDRFLSMYNEYANFPAITRTRMYLEALEEILPDIRVFVDDGTGVQTFLPLDDLIRTGN